MGRKKRLIIVILEYIALIYVLANVAIYFLAVSQLTTVIIAKGEMIILKSDQGIIGKTISIASTIKIFLLFFIALPWFYYVIIVRRFINYIYLIKGGYRISVIISSLIDMYIPWLSSIAFFINIHPLLYFTIPGTIPYYTMFIPYFSTTSPRIGLGITSIQAIVLIVLSSSISEIIRLIRYEQVKLKEFGIAEKIFMPELLIKIIKNKSVFYTIVLGLFGAITGWVYTAFIYQRPFKNPFDAIIWHIFLIIVILNILGMLKDYRKIKDLIPFRKHKKDL